MKSLDFLSLATWLSGTAASPILAEDTTHLTARELPNHRSILKGCSIIQYNKDAHRLDCSCRDMNSNVVLTYLDLNLCLAFYGSLVWAPLGGYLGTCTECHLGKKKENGMQTTLVCSCTGKDSDSVYLPDQLFVDNEGYMSCFGFRASLYKVIMQPREAISGGEERRETAKAVGHPIVTDLKRRGAPKRLTDWCFGTVLLSGDKYGMLYAVCYNTAEVAITTVIDLNLCLVRDNDQVRWQKDGGAFDSCECSSGAAFLGSVIQCSNCGSTDLDNDALWVSDSGVLSCFGYYGTNTVYNMLPSLTPPTYTNAERSAAALPAPATSPVRPGRGRFSNRCSPSTISGRIECFGAVGTLQHTTRSLAARQLPPPALVGGFIQRCDMFLVLERGEVYGLLQGTCSGKDGSQVHTQLDLNLCLANYDNHLAWSRQGGAFGSCTNCKSRWRATRYLDCDCGSVDLNDGVFVWDDGTLACYDFRGKSQPVQTVGPG